MAPHTLGTKDNPVRCSRTRGISAYLDQLCGPQGEALEYQRLGSTLGPDNRTVDVYRVWSPDGRVDLDVHVDLRHDGQQEAVAVRGLLTVDQWLAQCPWTSPAYLMERRRTLANMGILTVLTPDQRHLWTHAGLMLALGPRRYARSHGEGRPATAEHDEALLQLCGQIVHDLHGFGAMRPLRAPSAVVASHLLHAFRYRVHRLEHQPGRLGRNIIAMHANPEGNGPEMRFFIVLV